MRRLPIGCSTAAWPCGLSFAINAVGRKVAASAAAPPHPMIKAISFDATETLIHLVQSVGENYRDIAAASGVQLDAEALDQAFRRAWKGSPARVSTGRARPDDDKGWWHALVMRVLDQVLVGDQTKNLPREAYFERLYDHFAQAGVWAVFPEVHEVLGALQARGFLLGVVSNFDRRLYRVFDQLALTPYFQRIVVSSEVGADKPDPAIFRYALDALRVTPDEALHVGDDPKRDWGAEALGMAIFKLERPRNSLRDLVPFLDEENLRAATR